MGRRNTRFFKNRAWENKTSSGAASLGLQLQFPPTPTSISEQFPQTGTGLRVQKEYSFVWVAGPTNNGAICTYLSPPMTVLQGTQVLKPLRSSVRQVCGVGGIHGFSHLNSGLLRVLQKMKEGRNLVRTEGQGDVDMYGGWGAPWKPGGL